jgi:hypothetical protein
MQYCIKFTFERMAMSIVHLQDMKLNQNTTPAAALIDKVE